MDEEKVINSDSLNLADDKPAVRLETVEEDEPTVASTMPHAPVSQPQVFDMGVQPEIEGARAGKDMKWLILATIVVLVAAATVWGIVLWQRGANGGRNEVVPSPSPQAEASPTPTPVAAIDLDEYTLKVLNGSGKAGEAGKAKLVLEEAGFKVTSTGNADNYDYTEVVVNAGNGVSAEVVTKIKEILGDKYVVVVEVARGPQE